MSVLIKGMEMPSNCAECPLNHDAECAVKNCMVIDDCYEIRAAWCPIIELPPHGRLIDADALFFTDFTLAQIALEKENPFKNLAIAIFEKIESAPTIIPAEEGE